MALLWFGGGETALGDADFRLKWTSEGLPSATLGTIATPRAGSVGTRSFYAPAIADSYITVASISPIIVEFWWKNDRANNGEDVLKLADSSSNAHARISFTSDGVNTYLQVKNSANTQVGTTYTVGAIGTWVHIGVKLTVGDAGTFVVKFDDNIWYNASSDFKNGTSNTVDRVIFRLFDVSSQRSYFDDAIIMDTTGSTENDFLGSGINITGHNVNGAGDSAQFTPSAGSNFENVDELDPDDDTTYNSSSTAGQLDLYNIGDLPAISANVLSARIYAFLRKDSGGTEQAKLAIKTNSVVYYGSTESLTNSYAVYKKQYDTNPNTLVKFIQSEINALQVGVEVV